MSSPSLLDLRFEELEERLEGLASYRADQIWHAAYLELAASYEEITTLPLALRRRLAEDLPFPTLDPVGRQTSRDRTTRKTLHRLADGETIESVTMIYEDRATACVSSQVGCAVGCTLCATGQSGFRRDLAPGEIVAQVLEAARLLRGLGRRLSRVVYMGMGEPFLNYDATLQSIRILNDARGFALGARAFTISTAGVVPGIDRLAEEPLQVNLAISLHAADDATRDRLVPINRRYPIGTLLEAIRRYIGRTRRRVTFEIALIDGVNDRVEHAEATADLLKGLLCHVNLIPCNDTPSAPARRSPSERISAYADRLAKRGIPVTVRRSMGTDIEAGCGQLRARSLAEQSDSEA
jgi:23S rRNA (adenine2503-C2)-methyltransferase